MGCGGSSNTRPENTGKNSKKKKGRKKGKGTPMMRALGETKADKFWDDDRLLTAKLVKGNSACEGDGKLAIAYVDRPLHEDKGSRYNFIVRRS